MKKIIFITFAAIILITCLEVLCHPLRTMIRFIREESGYYYDSEMQAYNLSVRRFFNSPFGSKDAKETLGQIKISDDRIIWIGASGSSFIFSWMNTKDETYQYNYAFCDFDLNFGEPDLCQQELKKDDNEIIEYDLIYSDYYSEFDGVQAFNFLYEDRKYTFLYRVQNKIQI